MAFPGSSIVPKKLVESGHDLNATPVGSGPFKFVDYQPRSMVRFEKNPDYFQTGKPYFDAMEYHLIADVTALTDAVVAGEVNFSNEIPPKDWAMVSTTPGIVGQTLEGSRFYWLLPNNTHEPMSKPLVRQAMAHAVDRAAIVAGTFFGQAVPLLGGVILLVGFWLANLVHTAIARTGTEHAKGLARIAQLAILGLVIAMGLRAMGLADDIVNLAFGLTFGAVAVALALSFGLGGREAAGKQMEHWLSKLRK